MTNDEKFSAAAHLYVLMRRRSGRVIDSVWLSQNAEYAREVLRLVRDQRDAELDRLAERFENLMFGAAGQERPAMPDGKLESAKYVGSLR